MPARHSSTEARRARLVALVRAGTVTVTAVRKALGCMESTMTSDRKALVSRGVLVETRQGRTVVLSIRARRGRPADVARPTAYVDRTPTVEEVAAACRANSGEAWVVAHLAEQEARRQRELAEAPSQRAADTDGSLQGYAANGEGKAKPGRNAATIAVTVGPYGEVRAIKPADGVDDDLRLVTEPGTDEGVYEGDE